MMNFKISQLATIFFNRFFAQARLLSGSCLAVLLWLIILPSSAMAWPTDSQWLELVKDDSPIQDAENDASGGVNVVPDDDTHAAAYIYNDGAYLYYRIRVDSDPSGNNGVFAQFGWGFEIDTDQNAADYEWLIMCDGITSPEVISLRENTDKTGVGDPSDKAEYIAAEYPLVGNHRLLLADTSINGDQDYFVDFRMPFSVFKAATGITDDSLIRYFVGSSRSTNNLTDNGADLVAGSNLYEMSSDYVTPFGTLPIDLTFYDGTVAYTEDLAGTGDKNLAAPGDTLYIRVDDLDLDTDTNPLGTLRVTLTSPTGDSEILILTAAGVQGKYTGSIPTSTTDAAGTLHVLDGQTVTVTYVEAVAADRSQSVSRTDAILFATTGTDVGITKTVDTAVANEGDTVTFTVTATNNGPSAITALTITETLPGGMALVLDTPSQGSYANGSWTVGSLAAGSSATLTLQMTVNTDTNDTIQTNTASLVSSTPIDRYAANNSASASVAIGGTDLRVTKDVTDPLPTEGDTITYRVRVINLGPNAASGVDITDSLPDGVTYVSDNSNGSYNPSTGIWNVGDLATGTGALLRIEASVDAGTTGQTLTNTASVFALDQLDSDPSNDSASADIRIDYIDLELSKSVSDETPDEGDTITWTITVDNNGPHDATGIEVTDLLPSGVTYVSYSADQGTYVAGTGIWTVGDVDENRDATLTITATVDSGTAGQSILNEAEITNADQSDSSPGNEYASAEISVAGTDLQISKSVSNANPTEGDSITWTITVRNNGPNSASGIEITDILPTGVSYSSDTASQGSYDNKKTRVWSVGTLPVYDGVNGEETLQLVSTVDSGTSGQTIVNVAFITASDQSDPDAFNNTDSATIAVDGADLGIVKTVNNTTPNIGEIITYTLTVTNGGPNTATNVAVTDLLPPDLSYQGDTPSQGSYTSATGIWTVGTLNDGATATLTLSARVLDQRDNLTITNTATISASDQADANTANNSSSVDITIAATDLAVTKMVDNATPSVGGSVVYTVTVENLGTNTATNVEIDDILPTGVTYVSHLADQGNYAAGLWLLGDLAGSSSVNLLITATVDSGTGGRTITNTASVLSLDQIDTNSANDSDSVDIVPVFVIQPTLLIMKSADVATIDPGGTITYTVQVTNSGAGAATSVVLTDSLSPYAAWGIDWLNDGAPYEPFLENLASIGLTIQSLTFSNDDGANFNYNPTDGGGGAPAGFDGNVTNWKLTLNGSMNSGNSFTLQYRASAK